MKRRILLLLVALMVIPTIAFGGMTVVKKKGGAASGTYSPNADVSLGGWSGYGDDVTDIYEYIDDAERYNTEPATANDEIGAVFDATTYEFQFPEITGTINTLRVWVYGYDKGNAAGICQVNISQDGTNWQTNTNISMGDEYADRAWAYVDFTSLSWTNTTDLRVRLVRTGEGNAENWTVIAVYVEANPS